MLRKELADALGISASMVTRLAKQGMPTGDVAAARKWRDRHLQTARRKEYRVDTGMQMARPVDQPRDRVLVELDELVNLALELGLDPVPPAVVARVRAALAAVPMHARESVRMPEVLWDQLTAEVRSRLGTTADPDQAASDGGRCLYAAAAGELQAAGEIQ